MLAVLLLTAASSSPYAFNLTRDAFGVPHVNSTTDTGAFYGVGVAQAEDRLFQIFLRIATATGRLAEFLGPGEGRVNVESDTDALRRSYTDAEVLAQFEALSEEARGMLSAFARGMLLRAAEVAAEPATLLPYEFGALGVESLPLDLFELVPTLHYGLFVMRGLCNGFDPTYQLQNLETLQLLSARLGEAQGWAAFEDVATAPGAFPLRSTVVGSVAANGTSAAEPRRRRPRHQLPGARRLAVARRVASAARHVEAERLRLGAVTADGSWAIVDGSNEGLGFAQYAAEILPPSLRCLARVGTVAFGAVLQCRVI